MQRAAPCLFWLYTVTTLLYTALPEQERIGRARRRGKCHVTFSHALTVVRRRLWRGWVLPQAGGTAVEDLPEPLAEIFFAALAPAA